ncbi:MAG TPA: HDOD domain-containing protein [Kofleriaceae bacterium]|nr:HDOD domain-containing protein [Kofleriaceae bacterium]
MQHLAYVGRQAIFDRQRRTVGYELLFRDSDENRARFDDADRASATTLVNAVVELGLGALAGHLPVWVNLTERFLLGEYPIPLPPERTVLEVLETVPVTSELIESLAGLRRRGFTIALDDFVLTDRTRPLLAVADRIKLDVLGVGEGEVARRLGELRAVGVPVLAEKVSTPEEYTAYHAMGFDLFQGYYLELPIVSKARRLPHDRSRLVRILARLYDPRTGARELEALVAGEVGLSVRLLRLAGSTAFARGTPVGTVGQAIMRLGTQAIAALVVLILASGFDDKPLELARQALVRARTCELLARRAGQPPGELFTAGLLSLIDGILDRPLAEVLADLSVTSTISGALAGDGTTAAARIVEAARRHDRGELEEVAETGLAPGDVFTAWFESIQWVDQVMAAL